MRGCMRYFAGLKITQNLLRFADFYGIGLNADLEQYELNAPRVCRSHLNAIFPARPVG